MSYFLRWSSAAFVVKRVGDLKCCWLWNESKLGVVQNAFKKGERVNDTRERVCVCVRERKRKREREIVADMIMLYRDAFLSGEWMHETTLIQKIFPKAFFTGKKRWWHDDFFITGKITSWESNERPLRPHEMTLARSQSSSAKKLLLFFPKFLCNNLAVARGKS